MLEAVETVLSLAYESRKRCVAKLPIEGYPGRAVQVIEGRRGDWSAIEVEAIGTAAPRFFSGKTGFRTMGEALNFALSLQGWNLIAVTRFSGTDPDGSTIEEMERLRREYS